MEFTTNRSNLGSEHSYRHEVQNPTANLKRVLLTLEPAFSNMYDPSVVIEPPDNNWRSDNRQTSQTSLSGHVSRRDQSREKHKSKKRRRHRFFLRLVLAQTFGQTQCSSRLNSTRQTAFVTSANVPIIGSGNLIFFP